MSVTAFPLSWPPGRERARWRKRAAFGRRDSDGRFAETTLSLSRSFLADEVNRIKAKDAVLSTNVPLRLDGLPRADAREPSDPGVAVYFTTKDGQQVCFACDRWDRVADNITAIAKTIEAIRGIERWGSGDMVRAAFSGFRQRHTVLDLDPIKANEEAVDVAFRALARKYHPDAGGSTAQMALINEARAQGLAAVRAREVS